MIGGAQRTVDFRRGRLGGPDDGLLSSLANSQEMQLMGHDPSQRATNRGSFQFRGMHSTTIFLDGGGKQTVKTSRPWDVRKPDQNFAAITEAGSALRKPGLVRTGYRFNVPYVRPSTNVAFAGAGQININRADGGSVTAHSAVNFGNGVNGTRVMIDTADHHNMVFGGGTNVTLKGAVILDNSYLRGGVNVVSGEASFAGVRGNGRVNGKQPGVVARDALEHATREAFSGPMEYHGMPRDVSINHAAAQRDMKIAVPQTVFAAMSESYAAQLKAQMAMQHGSGSVRRNKLEQDGLAHPQMA